MPRGCLLISGPLSAGFSQGLRIAVWCGQRRGLSPPPPVCPDRAVREEGGFSLEEQRGAAPTGGCVPSSASPPLAPQSPHGTGDPPHSRRIPGPKDSGGALGGGGGGKQVPWGSPATPPRRLPVVICSSLKCNQENSLATPAAVQRGSADWRVPPSFGLRLNLETETELYSNICHYN